MKCQLKVLDYGLVHMVDELRDIVNEVKTDGGGEKGIDEDTVIEQLNIAVDGALEGKYTCHGDTVICSKTIIF